ncbi:MAG: polymer-forming cytoskeletal protein [Brachymonas sp.]|nr:polymer-forming cytoskeletal protein [Brachymonas sp.]
MFGSNKKQALQSASNQPVDTLISQHCTIEGNLVTQNSVKVDGRIQGNLQATGQAIVGEQGVVHGDIHVADLLVFGRIEGNIHAKSVQLKPTARILGDIETDTLQVEPGARYQGSVRMANGATDPQLLLANEQP